MASDLQEQSCWRAARPCPLSDSSSNHKLSCQAWFRCETAGDYVIRWRCQSSEEGELNITNTGLSLCSNKSDSVESSECPPPVVCPDDPYLDKAHLGNSDLSTDVVLAIAVSIFAFLAMLLIVVSSYKYWRLKKRLRHRMVPSHYMIRDCPYPVRYHNLWGTGYQHWGQDSGKKSQSSRSNGSSHPDVYFSRPQEPASYFERLLFPLDDLMNYNKDSMGSGPSTPRRMFSSPGKLAADPSVATGSFVFHQPIGGGGLSAFEGRIEGWTPQNKQVNKDKEAKEKSLECFQIYKGNMRKMRTHESQHATGKCTNNMKEYKRLQNASPDFNRVPQVSSITIPTFELGGLHRTMAEHEYMNPHMQVHEDIDEHFLQKKSHQTKCSDENVSRYAVTRTGSNQHYIMNSQSHHQSNINHYQSVSPRSIYATHSSTTHPSPDVISSHNFTNRFVRVGKNVYRPLLSKSASVGSISMSSSTNDYVELSYDSFRNEHQKELAKRGAASSSTLEAGYRQKGYEKSTALNNRY